MLPIRGHLFVHPVTVRTNRRWEGNRIFVRRGGRLKFFEYSIEHPAGDDGIPTHKPVLFGRVCPNNHHGMGRRTNHQAGRQFRRFGPLKIDLQNQN